MSGLWEFWSLLSQEILEVDGVNVDNSNRTRWQSRVAYVPQDVYLLDATIAQNGVLGIQESDIDRGRLLEAIRLTKLDEFVGTLPRGVDQRIGERGIELSGGQRQRIGIARALYKDASVRACDVIVALDLGKVVGTGTYDELLMNSDAFRHRAGIR